MATAIAAMNHAPCSRQTRERGPSLGARNCFRIVPMSGVVRPGTKRSKDRGRLRPAQDVYAGRTSYLPTPGDGRMLRTGSARNLLRFLRGPSVRLERLWWYRNARPRYRRAHRHQGSLRADGL